MGHLPPLFKSRVRPGTRCLATASLLGLAILLAATLAMGRERPQIVRHDANYLDRALVLTIHWQSPNPVTTVRAYVGNLKKEIKVDEYDNKRNQDGYWGEATIELKVEPGQYQDAIPYLLQIEDDLKQKSEQVSGKLKVVAARLGDQPDDGWGREHLKGFPVPGAPAGDVSLPAGGAISAGPGYGTPYPTGPGYGTPSPAGQYPGGSTPGSPVPGASYGAGPVIERILVNRVQPGRITFSISAYDQVGLREITIRIYDMAGGFVAEQPIRNLAQPNWQGDTEAMPLGPGTYRARAEVTGGSGTTSQDLSEPFTIDAASGQPVGAPATTGVVSGSPRVLQNDAYVPNSPAPPATAVSAGDEIAAVLGPVERPFRILKLAFQCMGTPDAGTFGLKIYEDAGSEVPGRLIFEGNLGQGQCTSAVFPEIDMSAQNIVAPAGSVRVSLQHLHNGAPAVAIDGDGLSQYGRNWFFHGGRWAEFSAAGIRGDAVIRLTVQPQ